VGLFEWLSKSRGMAAIKSGRVAASESSGMAETMTSTGMVESIPIELDLLLEYS
jgi:hypothetical protein